MAMRLIRSVTAAAIACLAAGPNVAAEAPAQSRPAVVELFTAEGCSSCPPAETYLGELARRSDVLALAFHVDYWDDLGWRDRFELTQAAERQRTYAHALRLSSVYTPQVVIDGRADFVGSDRKAIGTQLGLRSGVPVAISLMGKEVLIDIPAQERAAPGEVVLVAYLRKAVSPIGRGENAGRTIQEFNIVRALRPLGRWEGRAQSFRTSRSSLPPDATDVAVLIQAPGQGPIVGAAATPLS